MATLITIRQAVRDSLNEEYEGFYTNTKLNRVINRKYKALSELIARRCNFYLKRSNITTTAGIYLYTITSSTMMPVKEMVNIVDTTGQFLRKIGYEYVDGTITGSSATGFDVLGNQIALYPKPSVTGTVYTAIYHEVPTELSGDSSALSLPGGDLAEAVLIDMVLLECQYQSGDTEMYQVTRSRLKDDKNNLWALLDTTEHVTIDNGDFRLETVIY